jgi:hypothetical protein
MKIRLALVITAVSALVAFPSNAKAQSYAPNVLGPGAPIIYDCVAVNLLGLTVVTEQTSPCVPGTQGQKAGTIWSAEINVNGSVKSGSNFVRSVVHIPNSGVYALTFTSSFAAKPSCSEELVGQSNNLGTIDADDNDSETVSGVTVATTSFEDYPTPAEGTQYVDLPFKVSCFIPQ